MHYHFNMMSSWIHIMYTKEGELKRSSADLLLMTCKTDGRSVLVAKGTTLKNKISLGQSPWEYIGQPKNFSNNPRIYNGKLINFEKYEKVINDGSKAFEAERIKHFNLKKSTVGAEPLVSDFFSVWKICHICSRVWLSTARFIYLMIANNCWFILISSFRCNLQATWVFSVIKYGLDQYQRQRHHVTYARLARMKFVWGISFATTGTFFGIEMVFCKKKAVVSLSLYIYIHHISFQTFIVWALLWIVLTWNSSTLRSNPIQLQCLCCTVPTTSGRPHGSPLVWTCQ